MDFLEYNQFEVTKLLDLDISTASNLKKNNPEHDKYNSTYLNEVDNLISTGKRVFGNLENLRHWLNTENVALGNKKPIVLVKNNKVEDVIKVLHSLSWGSFYRSVM